MYLSFVLILSVCLANGQMQIQPQPGQLGQSIYQFIKSSQLTSQFGELLDRTAQQSNDPTVVNALSSSNNGTQQSGAMYTVFVPMNNAFNQLPTDMDQLRNDVNNLILKEYLTLDRIRQMNGRNVSRTFGYMPRLVLRVVPNHYSRLVFSKQASGRVNRDTGRKSEEENIDSRRKKRQMATSYYGPPTTPGPYVSSSTLTNYYGPPTTSSFYNQNYAQPTASLNYPPGGMPPGYNANSMQNSMYGSVGGGVNQTSSYSIYDQYATMFGVNNNAPYDGPSISPKLPQDELFLLNSAIILDKVDLTNGVVYIINSFPRYYDKSLYALLRDNTVGGLGQNLNFWISRAEQSYRQGQEGLRNALNAFGSSTYFLPTDQAFNKFPNRDLLNNNTYLVDMLLRSHRVDGQILFDHYLDNAAATYFTDTRLPVSARHRRVNGADDIEISIGHVKGKILPEFRNIYCASGVIHLVDTVLGIPTRSAYQQLSQIPELSTFKQLVDISATYRQLLDQMPSQMLNFPSNNNSNQYNQYNQYNQQGGYNQANMGSNQMYTILAPSDAALLTVKDDVIKFNSSVIDTILSAHIIKDSSNRIFYTDHDEALFQNGQTYNTLMNGNSLLATVQPDPNGISNVVSLALQRNPQIVGSITNGNDRVSNGVIHVVDTLLFPYQSSDITTVLDRYSALNTPGTPAFSQFIEVLRSTGVMNDLKQQGKQFTLFIPTNDALKGYQDIVNGNDMDRKKNLVYRHLCLDRNLQSNNLQSNGTLNNNPYQNPGYAPNNPSYTTNNPIYSTNNQGYNPNNPGFNTNNPNNPNSNPNPSNPGYNPNNPSYNANNPSYNPNNPSYNPNNPGYNPNNQNNPSYNPNNQGFNPNNQNNQGYNPNNQGFNQNQLTCRNALGQELALIKDTNGLIMYHGLDKSKILTNFPGTYQSAYLLERPLLNVNNNNYNIQTQARAHSYNSAANLLKNISVLFVSVLFTLFSKI